VHHHSNSTRQQTAAQPVELPDFRPDNMNCARRSPLETRSAAQEGNGQEPSAIVVSLDPNGSGRWVVSVASATNPLSFLFTTQREACRAANAMAIEGVDNGEDFAGWTDRHTHTLRTSAVEATIDLADAVFADAMARKERDGGT
jgi:hypothetical protein